MGICLDGGDLRERESGGGRQRGDDGYFCYLLGYPGFGFGFTYLDLSWSCVRRDVRRVKLRSGSSG